MNPTPMEGEECPRGMSALRAVTNQVGPTAIYKRIAVKPTMSGSIPFPFDERALMLHLKGSILHGAERLPFLPSILSLLHLLLTPFLTCAVSLE
jgi:hypothetical protein